MQSDYNDRSHLYSSKLLDQSYIKVALIDQTTTCISCS